ncbi:YfcE family phosphodiesterase [Bythopirellula goksoeyrii]|uniref:Phosphoesterase n=1 Tax=Bythopirellula goksoeyrii TaxID=1400387 RepID=A0A5B9QE33_9BACT|nr:YfcE family phosphodiesterase [Bythopirellula goksoeyrii]QEG35890.1 phosphodiesterase [Bythopirellula goksoeyrii]
MRVGIFADSHDHLDNIRLAVERFNKEQCDYVLFAGDLISTIAVPPLRSLNCPLVGCFGDNEGNKPGLRSGLSIVSTLFGDPPVFFGTDDGTKFVLTHMERQLRGVIEPFDIAVYGHTHKPRIGRDAQGRLHINPGETGGWSFGRPTIAMVETSSFKVEIINLREPDGD